MDVTKLKSDYEEIKDKVLDEIYNNSSIPPNMLRCHEMMFLTKVALTQKGYSCIIEDGIFKEPGYNEYHEIIYPYLDHSWIRIKGKGVFDSAIIHFLWHSPSIITQTYDAQVYTEWKDKRKFKKAKIEFKLYEGIEELSKKIFPSSN